MTTKKIIITGGAGFIGSNLAIKLVELGHDVIVFDNLVIGKLENLQSIKNKIKFIKGDIVKECNNLLPVLKEGVDVIYHLAASFANELSIKQPIKDAKINTQGTINILELANKMNVKHVIYASSSSCYGAGQIPFKEDNIMLPSTPYAISKLAGEQYTIVYNKVYELPVTVLRYFNVYGRYDYPGKFRNVIPNFFNKALNKEELIITGKNSARDFTYIIDAVEMTIRAMTKKRARGEIINVSKGEETNLIKIANIINKLTGNNEPIKITGARNWDNIPRRLASTKKAEDILEYKAKIPIEEGLERTYEWFKSWWSK